MKAKLATIILSFIVLTSSGCGPKENPILVPCNHNGWVLVVFDQTNGMPDQEIQGKRYFEPDSAGLCITSGHPIRGFLDTRFFCLEEDGSVRELIETHQSKKISGDERGVFGFTVGRQCDAVRDVCFVFDAFWVGAAEDGDQHSLDLLMERAIQWIKMNQDTSSHK